MSDRRARNLRALALILVVGIACALFVGWRSLEDATERSRRAAAAHAATLVQARELERLRRRATVVEDRPRPESDLVASLQEALRNAGADRSTLSRVSAGEPAPIGEGPYARVSASVTLQRVSAAGAARVVAAWRAQEPLWVVRSVRLRHAGTRRASDEASFTLELQLENAFLAGPPPASPAETSMRTDGS